QKLLAFMETQPSDKAPHRQVADVFKSLGVATNLNESGRRGMFTLGELKKLRELVISDPGPGSLEFKELRREIGIGGAIAVFNLAGLSTGSSTFDKGFNEAR